MFIYDICQTGRQELLTLPDHLSSLSFVSGVHVAQSYIFCVVFYGPLFVFSSHSCGFVFCLPLASIYRF